MDERREFNRVWPVAARVIVDGRGDAASGRSHEVRNISQGGVLFTFPTALKVNEIVQLSFDCTAMGMAHRPSLRAMVVRCVETRDGYDVACMFINPSKEELQQVKIIMEYRGSDA